MYSDSGRGGVERPDSIANCSNSRTPKLVENCGAVGYEVYRGPGLS